jgi:hypothetical protein
MSASKRPAILLRGQGSTRGFATVSRRNSMRSSIDNARFIGLMDTEARTRILGIAAA